MRQFARKVAGWFSLTSESGVTAIEYGLIAALIAVVIIAGLTLIGTNLQSIFAYIAGKITTPS
jgi:pilus assembly protein Flp/PilA